MNQNKSRLIGIMSAMPEEVDGIINLLSDREEFQRGMRTYHKGRIDNVPVVVVFSRWGKVAAATTVTALITEFKITELIFTGVAGAIHTDLNVGDIVIGDRFIQHDLDARPLMKRFEIPLLGKTYLEGTANRIIISRNAIEKLISSNQLLKSINSDVLFKFGIRKPNLFVGEIASGDQFFASHLAKQNLQVELPDVLCVEMEGAAVAQVCYEYEIPYTIIRTISDTADDNAHIDFATFIKNIASPYAAEIIQQLIKQHHIEQ